MRMWALWIEERSAKKALQSRGNEEEVVVSVRGAQYRNAKAKGKKSEKK